MISVITSLAILASQRVFCDKKTKILFCCLFTVRNASMSLGSVDSTVQRADELKNVTATLQAQLKQNMTALEEKLRKAREYVAKVDNVTYLILS